MTAWRILSSILLIILLLGFLRVGAELTFGDTKTVRLRIGCIKFSPHMKNDKKKAEKSAEKTAESSAAAPKKKRSLPRPTAEEALAFLPTLLETLRRTLRRTCKRLRLDPLEVTVIFAGSDPYEVAKRYGYANAAMWALLPRLEEIFYIPDPACHLRMDYGSERTRASGEVAASVRLCDLFAIAFTLAVPLWKWYRQLKKAHPQPSEGVTEDNRSEKLSA